MINTTCSLCDSDNYKIINKYGIIGPKEYGCNLAFCLDCNHNFTLFSNDIIFEKLYEKGKYVLIDTRGSIFDKIISINNKIIIYELYKLKIINKNLLDFGAGKGHFLYSALSYGWKVQGIETAKARAKYGIQEYGLNINTYEYKGEKINDSPFNVITLFHVLEHIQHPKELLAELIDNNLSKNGYLVIEVPLFDSLQSKISGRMWLHLDPPLHLSHFTKYSLFKLIEELKLTPVKCSYTSIHLGILGMVQSIMSLFGYKALIIDELKFNRNKFILIAIFFVLPFAFILEILSILFKRGGIIRVYCKKDQNL